MVTKCLDCHNCRRRRHRCDRSVPGCNKCIRHGEECLGYGPTLRWTNAMALRGKLAGSVLVDPLLQNLSTQARLYINHFNRLVCVDLVSFDSPEHTNPFRSMIPLIDKHAYLREVVFAISAMHLAALRRACSSHDAQAELVNALASKQRAIQLVRGAVEYLEAADVPIFLSAVVFLINFDLIDTGTGEWKVHMEAAGTLIATLKGAGARFDVSLGPLCDAIVADCLTYHILGSTINTIDNTTAKLYAQIDVASFLRRAEAVSYHCCPPKLLELVLAASRLCRAIEAAGEPEEDHILCAVALMEQAVAFDIESWVRSIRNLSSHDDIGARIHIGLAHQVAVRLYILLAAPEASAICGSHAEDLAAEILQHLSNVPINHILLKGTTWPTFFAGTQMDDPALRQWCRERLAALWGLNPFLCPWGYIQTARNLLESIWEARDREKTGDRPMNWLQLLKGLPVNCLIV
ncbi:hypothetical protein GQ53DRAFT_786577 [Thozetella sp. PMI_491]|nr:hypothetical protein GQ53DRAFT_786577 [Thozetella sp. PMI_491]